MPLYFRIYKVIKHEFFFFFLQYLQGLEDSLQEFNDQNKKLQVENELLKKKLQFLQDEVICCTF
jgi:regulator of replication initiation timing